MRRAKSGTFGQLVAEQLARDLIFDKWRSCIRASETRAGHPITTHARRVDFAILGGTVRAFHEDQRVDFAVSYDYAGRKTTSRTIRALRQR